MNNTVFPHTNTSGQLCAIGIEAVSYIQHSQLEVPSVYTTECYFRKKLYKQSNKHFNYLLEEQSTSPFFNRLHRSTRTTVVAMLWCRFSFPPLQSNIEAPCNAMQGNAIFNTGTQTNFTIDEIIERMEGCRGYVLTNSRTKTTFKTTSKYLFKTTSKYLLRHLE